MLQSREERKKDEEHRLLLQLNTEQRGSLDADAKANLVDFYYEEEERFAVWCEVEKKRVKEAKKEAKKEERAEKGKAALEITKSQGKSTG